MHERRRRIAAEWQVQDTPGDPRMSDETEAIRRQQLAEINAQPGSREALEAEHGQVWDTQELGQDFTVEGFSGSLRRRPAEVGRAEWEASCSSTTRDSISVSSRTTSDSRRHHAHAQRQTAPQTLPRHVRQDGSHRRIHPGRGVEQADASPSWSSPRTAGCWRGTRVTSGSTPSSARRQTWNATGTTFCGRRD